LKKLINSDLEAALGDARDVEFRLRGRRGRVPERGRSAVAPLAVLLHHGVAGALHQRHQSLVERVGVAGGAALGRVPRRRVAPTAVLLLMHLVCGASSLRLMPPNMTWRRTHADSARRRRADEPRRRPRAKIQTDQSQSAVLKRSKIGDFDAQNASYCALHEVY